VTDDPIAWQKVTRLVGFFTGTASKRLRKEPLRDSGPVDRGPALTAANHALGVVEPIRGRAGIRGRPTTDPTIARW